MGIIRRCEFIEARLWSLMQPSKIICAKASPNFLVYSNTIPNFLTFLLPTMYTKNLMHAILALFTIVNCIATIGLFLLVSKHNREAVLKNEAPSLSTGMDEVLLPTSVKVSKHYLLVVVILSRPNAKECRNAIRKTWIKGYQKRPQGVLVKFSIGISGLSEQVLSNLANEQKNFNDLMLFHNVHDSYSNLTMKVLNSFVYVNNNYNFSYILKSDDDTFIALKTIVGELKKRKSNKSYYWGYISSTGKVLTKGKFAEHRWFLSTNYLPYAMGLGYILSSDLIRYITVNHDMLMLYNNEDVSVGTWISPYEVVRRHDKRFIVYYEKCKRYGIVVNPVSISKMYKMYKIYIMKGTIC